MKNIRICCFSKIFVLKSLNSKLNLLQEYTVDKWYRQYNYEHSNFKKLVY